MPLWPRSGELGPRDSLLVESAAIDDSEVIAGEFEKCLIEHSQAVGAETPKREIIRRNIVRPPKGQTTISTQVT